MFARPNLHLSASRRLAAIASAVLLTIAIAAPVAAAPGLPVPAAGGDYCVTHLTEPGPDGQSRADTTCYASYADSLVAATSGRLRVSPDFRPEDLTQDLLDDVTPMGVLTNWVIGQDWEHENRGGAVRTYTVSTSNAPCTGRTWEIDQLDLGWDQIISSGEGFSGCDRFDHWEDPDQEGAVRTCSTYCATMGVMNDQTSSLRWRD